MARAEKKKTEGKIKIKLRYQPWRARLKTAPENRNRTVNNEHALLGISACLSGLVPGLFFFGARICRLLTWVAHIWHDMQAARTHAGCALGTDSNTATATDRQTHTHARCLLVGRTHMQAL
jgi:hypothetical protein